MVESVLLSAASLKPTDVFVNPCNDIGKRRLSLVVQRSRPGIFGGDQADELPEIAPCVQKIRHAASP